ncbi:hypothetical protein BDF14DRAFT_1702124, partial [Spinellus fusiger]
PECPCRHIITSETTFLCSLCNNSIPALKTIHQEKILLQKEIQSLKEEIQQTHEKEEEKAAVIQYLNKKSEELVADIQTKSEEISALKSDIKNLNEKYIGQLDRVVEFQLAKEAVENELEELSRKLFEEANGMVAKEKKEKFHLEVAHQKLQRQLKETQERLSTEEMQLNELRQAMSTMDEIEHQKDQEASTHPSYPTIKDSNVRATRDLAALMSAELGVDNTDTMVGVDPLMMATFIDCVKNSPMLPLGKIHSLPFLKYCQSDSIEQCLRFGPNSRLSVKKLNEAILMNTCFIEDTPAGFADEQAAQMVDATLKLSASKTLLWERLNGTETYRLRQCQACGRCDTHLPLAYRFRVSYFDDWACIDRFCRDRLVAVCEFYMFIRNIRQNYYSGRSMLDLYYEMLRLRLQMFYASMGALADTTQQLGIVGDTIGKASSPRVAMSP